MTNTGRAAALAATRRLNGVGFAATGIAFAVVLVMLWSLVRSMSARIERLNEFAKRIADGDLTQASDVSAGRDEVGQLSTAITKIAERLGATQSGSGQSTF